MIWVLVLLFFVVLVPIVAILIDSPIGRAFARRLEGPVQVAPPPVLELARKVELMEHEVDELRRSVERLHEENQFLQKLLEDGGRRSALPPSSTS